MSNYTLNNIRRIITHIDENDYWDLHLNEDYVYSTSTEETCLSVLIDSDNPECINNDELLSVKDYFYDGACANGLKLNNIGYTGVDNGLIRFKKDRITNEEFYKLYTDSTYKILSGDTRLHLHKVSGNTCLFDYPLSIDDDGSIKLNGGFYQGFFRSGNDYAVLPTTLGPGEEWNLYFDIKKTEHLPESNKTLNDKYPNNKGIFFYIGTRAENKWVYLYDNIPLSGTPFGTCSAEDDDPLFDLIDEDIILSAQTYETNSGFNISSPNDDYILSDNKFLLFDRTPSGITISNYDGNELAMISYKKRKFDGNLFLYMNHTPTGYTTSNIDELEFSGGSETYDNKILINDIYNNALAFMINDDGSIGYRYLVKDCSDDAYVPYKTLTGISYPGLIECDKWYSIRVRMLGYSDGMKIMFYVNNKLKYITSKLPKLNLKKLDELNEKQEGVAYNISIGGGTQGLAETIFPDYMMLPSKVFPLEEHFAGSFIGNIKSFKFYTC